MMRNDENGRESPGIAVLGFRLQKSPSPRKSSAFAAYGVVTEQRLFIAES